MSTSKPPIIAIDAMGGDIGLDVTLAAVAHIQKRHHDVRMIVVGDEPAIRSHKSCSAIDAARIDIHHTTQVVAMDEAPANVLRHKTDSSMWKAIELVRDGKAQACVSAGNTGALMASSRYILKMLPGISRPAICAVVPSRGGHVHWLDLGANVDAKPEQLVQFAVMGSELVKAVDEKPNPIVGLLNIGEEAIKGNDMVKETSKLLEKTDLNYSGFVEGNDIFLKEKLDIVVCDGFVGNVALKLPHSFPCPSCVAPRRALTPAATTARPCSVCRALSSKATVTPTFSHSPTPLTSPVSKSPTASSITSAASLTVSRIALPPKKPLHDLQQNPQHRQLSAAADHD